MSLSRTWLMIGLAAAACSSGKTNDGSSAQVAATPPAPVPPPAKPAVDDRYDPGALGAITFALTEGTPAARAHFTRGLLALHSFWYDEATREFRAAITADPTMNMAYWGVAMSACKLLWGDDDLATAEQMIRQMPDPDRLSPREQTWVVALIELIKAGDVRSSRKRFAAAMQQLHAQYPDDESATFLAAALLATTRPEDPDTVEVRKRAAALALGVFEHNPKHPGAAHYLIHAYDTPELAKLALPYARAYAKLAPAAFHARHMPAHIFSRLGMWADAIASCQSAWDVSVAAAKREKLSADHHDFHSLNWLVEMNFELGRRHDADRAMKVFGDAVRAGLGRQPRGLYAAEVASYMMRTGEWARVDELLAPLDAPAADEGGPAPAATRAGAPAAHCAPAPAASPLELSEQQGALDARARAAAMLHDPVKTKRYIAEGEAVRAKLRPFLETMQPKEALARLDAAHALRLEALLARASGDDHVLLVVQRKIAAAAKEETGGESNPTAFIAHEEIADTLMRLHQPKEAGAEYALVLQTHPGRAHALLGAARAATQAGTLDAARARYQQLADQWSGADEGTDGLAEVRAAVAAGK
jgi:tetratricopeptide (TPR) repeat protein